MTDFTVPTDFSTDDWTLVGTGTAALLPATKNGVLQITNGPAPAGQFIVSRADKTWSLEPGLRTWYSCRVQLSDTDIEAVGLADTAASPTEAVAFIIIGGVLAATTLSGGNQTILEFPNTYDFTNSYVELSWVYSGNRIDFYVNGNRVGTITMNIPAVLLQPIFNLQGLDGVPDTMNIDYLLVAQQRS
jgi:hypothetical protein